jgi:nucleoid-associated protein YgaU
MPELISNPQSEPDPQWSDGSGHVAHDGPDGLPHPGIVIRYDAATDLSDREDDPDDDDGEEPEPDSEPASGGGAADRARAILGAVAGGLLALSWACLRAAYRYPRWALVIVLSVVILGATALTRPGKSTPTAKILGESAAAPAPGPDKGKDPQKDKGPPKGDQPALADAGSPPAAKAEDGHKEAKKDGEASASPPALDPALPPGQAASKVADAGPTSSTTAEKEPSTINPSSANREPVPAPPPPSQQTDATLLAGPHASQAPAPPPPSTAQAPAPAGPAPSSPGTQGPPETTTAAVPGPNPELPPLSGSESSPPPISGSAPATTATTGQPAESTAPAPGADGKRPGGAESGNGPPSNPTPGISAEGAAGSGQQPAAPPETGPPAQQPVPQPGSPTPGPSPAGGPSNPAPPESASPSPLPPVTAPSQPLEPPGAAPKADPPAPAPTTEVEKGHDKAPKAGENKDQATPKAEAAKSATPEDRPVTDGESRTTGPARPGPAQGSKASGPALPASPSEPLIKPEGPAPGPDIHGREGAGGEKASANETNRPNLLDMQDLKPGQGEGATRAQGTTDQTEITAPKAGDGSPPREEARTTVPARPEMSPAASPASEPAGSRMPESSAGEAKGSDGSGVPASEPSDSTAKPTRDPAEGGWVRIPNKGRIPSDMGSDFVASGEAVRSGSESAPGRRAQDDRGIDVDSRSPAPRSGDTGARSADRPAEASRAGGRPSRVESTPHVVAHGENFWTISRLYYGSGRYYRALWKANSRDYPNIEEIHVNDVILIPAIEDLDPASIEQPLRRRVAGRDEGSTRDVAGGTEVPKPSSRGTPDSFPTTRTAHRSDASQGGPERRSERVDAALELPVAAADSGPSGDGRGPGEEGSGGPRSRLTARPRGEAPADRPVYKVRRYDTLRSIARDVLGDPRRADELYEINRVVIADPTRLVAGQLLELPEDADTRRLTARDRYRGRD